MLPRLAMVRLSSLCLVVSIPVLTACSGMSYRAAVGPMFALTNGDIGLQNAAGSLDLSQNRNDLDGNFGLGATEVSPYVRLEADKEKHRFRAHGFGIDAEGSGTLDGAFGGLVSGSQVNTSMEFFAIDFNYAYQIARGENWRFAAGAQVAFYSLDVAAVSPLGRETVETEGFVPMPFAEVEGVFGKFTVGVNGGIMIVDLGDAEGSWVDAEAYARFQVSKSFDVMGGYRYILFDVDGRAEDRDFEADLDIQGVFVTAGVRF